jgi:2-haloacid dehalogenase
MLLMPRVCVFDVMGTMLDLSALDPSFERVFGDKAIRQKWFQQMLQSAFVSIITDGYSDFGAIGRAALEMTAERNGTQLAEQDATTILRQLRELPAHPEVAESLTRLRDAGVRLAALTNSTRQVADAQLDHAGIRHLFEQTLSADSVRRLKPAPEPYRHAAERLGVDIGRLCMISAHGWDVAGAMRAGCAAAFVARPGMVLDPLVEPPDLIGKDLREITDLILERDR